jgi:hypothetical protein
MLDRDCATIVALEVERLRAEGKPANVRHIARKIFNEQYNGGGYQFRDIPADLMDRMKHKAVDEGGTVRDVIIKALIAYLG